MSKYDGEIRINTKIDTEKASSQLLSLQNRINKTAQKIDTLTQKMRQMEAPTIKTDAFKELENSMQEAQSHLQKLRDEQAEWESIGISSGGAWDALCEKIGIAEEKVFDISAQMDKLKASGGAFKSQKDTEAYKKIVNDLQNANDEMDMLKAKQQEVAARQQKINGNIGKTTQEAERTNKKFSNVLRTMKQMVLSMAVFSVMQNGIEAVKEGIQNLAKSSSSFNAKMSEMASATATLKNALATAFAPIITMITPAIVTLCNWITTAINKINQLIAALSGKSTWTRAKRQQIDYAGALEETAGAAKKAAGTLQSFNELNVISSQSSSGGGGSGEAEQFEEVPVSSDLIGKLQPFLDYLKKMKKQFINGWNDTWEQLDIDAQLENIRKSAESISQSLKEIFSSPDVLSAADDFVMASMYSLGQMAASTVSIGATVAQNLLGGISKYLEENSGRIKEYLVSMFDIGADIAKLAGDFSEAFAYVFEAFGSENGQRLTANLIGIFTNAFMGVTTICASLTRELLNIIIKPFVDNKDQFREALEGFLGTAADVCDTIKNTIDNTFDKLMEVYEEHIKPFLDSVAEGLSYLTGKLLEFWNTNVQPVMDNMASKFDAVMQEHIQPMLDKALELIGSIADALNVLWQQAIVPLIDWIIQNILPVLLPIFENLYDGFLTCIGYIADAITGIITTLKGVIDFIVGVFTGDWETAWNGISDIVTGIMEAIGGIIETVLAVIKTVVVNSLNVVKATFSTVFSAIRDWVKFAMKEIKTIITTIMGNIKTGISTALRNIKSSWVNIWTSMKDAVTNIFDGIWTAIKGTVNTILGGVEKMANGVINAINSMIDALNNLKFDAPDWVPVIGGNQFGFNINKINTISIPKLANGGITTGETLAKIGDNPGGQEAVLPLSSNTEWMDSLADKIASKLPAGSVIQIQGDPQGMFKIIRKEAGRYYRTTGNPAFDY